MQQYHIVSAVILQIPDSVWVLMIFINYFPFIWSVTWPYWLIFFRYEPLSHLLGNEYFFHAYGPIYILSADVVASLVALKNNR